VPSASVPDAVRDRASAGGDPDAILVGLVGAGIGPSLSPPLHEREASLLGLRYQYRRIDLDARRLPAGAVGDIVAATRRAGYRGLNVTHPCKQTVVPYLDELSSDAAALGAVNTVVFDEGKAIGHNTDWSGFARALATGLPGAALHDVLLLGAGGAGAAVAYGLLTSGAERVSIFDIDTARARSLAESLRSRFGLDRVAAGRMDDLVAGAAKVDGLVHATPTGMAAHPGQPVPAGCLRPGLWVADVVYRPLQTELVAAATRAGCRVLDGGRMAVFQAAQAFQLFTGTEPDTARMLRHFADLARGKADR
jgi:shikimate dehydrogenase